MANDPFEETPQSKPVGLTADQVELVQKWLVEHWGKERKCPMCETSSWIIGRYMVQPLTLIQQQLAGLQPSTVPPEQRYVTTWEVGFQFVPIFCKTCGQTVFLNAAHIGLFRRG